MRPGLVFISLFVLLMAIYFTLADTLGPVPTYALQAVVTLAILAVALWARRRAWRRALRDLEEQESPPTPAPPGPPRDPTP